MFFWWRFCCRDRFGQGGRIISRRKTSFGCFSQNLLLRATALQTLSEAIQACGLEIEKDRITYVTYGRLSQMGTVKFWRSFHAYSCGYRRKLYTMTPIRRCLSECLVGLKDAILPREHTPTSNDNELGDLYADPKENIPVDLPFSQPDLSLTHSGHVIIPTLFEISSSNTISTHRNAYQRKVFWPRKYNWRSRNTGRPSK